MYEAIEYDVLWDDIWHGGDDPQPVYHPDCDVQPGPDECEWSEPEARGEFDLYHARWEPGYLYAEHTYVRPCEGGN